MKEKAKKKEFETAKTFLLFSFLPFFSARVDQRKTWNIWKDDSEIKSPAQCKRLEKKAVEAKSEKEHEKK